MLPLCNNNTLWQVQPRTCLAHSPPVHRGSLGPVHMWTAFQKLHAKELSLQTKVTAKIFNCIPIVSFLNIPAVSLLVLSGGRGASPAGCNVTQCGTGCITCCRISNADVWRRSKELESVAARLVMRASSKYLYICHWSVIPALSDRRAGGARGKNSDWVITSHTAPAYKLNSFLRNI